MRIKQCVIDYRKHRVKGDIYSTKGLTPDQKKLHWENYAKKTERQELVFKKVFDNVFNEQKNQVVEQLKK